MPKVHCEISQSEMFIKQHKLSYVIPTCFSILSEREVFMHQSIPAPRTTAGHLPALSVPGIGALANFALSGGRAFANPGATTELLTRTWFPIGI